MGTYVITYWTGTAETVSAENVTDAFNRFFGGPVMSTGYNREGVWCPIDDDGKGHVYNREGDLCATIVG